jgi:hypothetical protein
MARRRERRCTCGHGEAADRRRRDHRAARVVQDGMAEVQGIRSPGTSLPGLVMVGTWRQTGRTTFAVCHGRRPAVLVDLKNAPFDRLVVTVDDPEQALAALT